LTDERHEGAAGASDTPPPPAETPELYSETPTDDRRDDEPDDAGDTSADDGRKRPPLPVILGAVLLLVAIGVGLAFVIPSGPVREADQLIPTAGPTAEAAQGDTSAQGSAPTALPLPEAVTGDPSEVIVQVGDGAILRGDFVRSYTPGDSPDQLLDQLIQRQLVVEQGIKEGIEVDQAQVDSQIAEIKQSQAGGDDEQFQAFLSQAQIGDEENLRRLLGYDQIIQEMLLKHTTAEQVHARHILLSTESISDTATVKTEADDLLKQLDGGADFAALAQEHSDDPGSAANGGDLGWALRGMYVGPFDEAVFSMQTGERRIVETEYGFHIVEVVEPAEVRNIQSSDVFQHPSGQQALNDTFMPWVEQLKQDAEAAQQIKILVPAEQLVAAPTQ
jgi:peptidyl-prolyl cis-trans isomerase C